METRSDLDLSVWEKACPLDAYCRQMQEYNHKVDAWRKEWMADSSPEQRQRMEDIHDKLASRDASLSTVFQKVKYDERDYPDILRIVGPVELAYIEQMRREFRLADRGFLSTPVDVFVWARGEPRCRSQTKVRGLPYRPRGKPWPQAAPESCRPSHPMTFLGQFNFCASRDLLPTIPGDVLLVFAEDETFGRPEALAFEWYDLGLESLVDKQDVPLPEWEFVCCHGYRHRTNDFRMSDASHGTDRLSESVLALQGTKIGGFPICPPDELYGTVLGADPEQLTFLCQINAIQPRSEQYYPWLNQREPAQLKDLSDPAQTLLLVDCGVLAFFLDSEGTMRWGFHTG